MYTVAYVFLFLLSHIFLSLLWSVLVLSSNKSRSVPVRPRGWWWCTSSCLATAKDIRRIEYFVYFSCLVNSLVSKLTAFHKLTNTRMNIIFLNYEQDFTGSHPNRSVRGCTDHGSDNTTAQWTFGMISCLNRCRHFFLSLQWNRLNSQCNFSCCSHKGETL